MFVRTHQPDGENAGLDVDPQAPVTPPPGEMLLSIDGIETFESFYARELRSVVGLAFVLSGSRTGAEDLAQDAFIAAYRKWPQISAYDKPGAWVRRVVANRAVSARRRATVEARALLSRRVERIVVPELSVHSEHVWAEVRRLPKRQAQVVVLRYLEGYTMAEIAETLDLSEPTVKTHWQRASVKLAERLER